MRLAALALVLATTAGTAKADAPLPFSVARVLSETRQVLVYDRLIKHYFLIEQNGWIGGYQVVAINSVDIVVDAGGKRFTVMQYEAEKIATTSLTGPTVRPPSLGPQLAPPQFAMQPMDPYADPPTVGPKPPTVAKPVSTATPEDPYATPSPVVRGKLH